MKDHLRTTEPSWQVLGKLQQLHKRSTWRCF